MPEPRLGKSAKISPLCNRGEVSVTSRGVLKEGSQGIPMTVKPSATNPDLVYTLRAKLDGAGHYDDFEVNRVVDVELNPNTGMAALHLRHHGIEEFAPLAGVGLDLLVQRIAQGHELVDLGDDAVLFREWRHRDWHLS